ncbi:right-handed parallel beta-helix repeat-containing protein [Klebsiella aerogenes]
MKLTIKNNNIRHNKGDGIHLVNTNDNTNIEILENSINNNGRDGVNISSGKAIINIEGNDIYDNQRFALHISSTIQELISKGKINNIPEARELENIPDVEIAHAYNKLISKGATTQADKEKVLKEIGFTKWVSKTADLATIASLIIQLVQIITTR